MNAAGWIGAAAAAGLAASAVLSAWLHWSRPAFVAGYAAAALIVIAGYRIRTGLSFRRQFARRWPAGLAGGLLSGALLARNVWSQPGSGPAAGLALAADLAWLGGFYGIVDAMLLTVIPVLAVYGSRSAAELARPAARLRWSGWALAASLVVAAAYHLGFAEFRGPSLAAPLIGNLIVTLSYLLTGSPVAPVLGHVIMHGAAVLHGAATTLQLPPHYP